MTDWRAEASRVIKAFDDALGRPPFPLNAPDDLVGKAQAVQETLVSVVAAGKLKSLDGVSEVTTTLPVLCASLREGTPNHTPCFRLYRPLLLAAAHASSFSNYPISYLLRDAEEVLGAQETPSATALRMACTVAGASAVELSEHHRDETKVENEVTLFTFMVLTHTLTPTHMRRFLRLRALESAATAYGSKRKGGKGGLKSTGGAFRAGGDDEKAHSRSIAVPCAEGGAEADACYSAVPRALLHSILAAPLSEECRAVFESFIDNTPKFLACVAGDGDLARRILDVYAARIVPKLKPSSLLLCLDAPLLDYYVDIVAVSQRIGHVTLLSSHEMLEVPLRAWDMARLRRLCCAAVSRSIGAEDAMASLLVYVFLYRIYCDLSEDETATAVQPSASGIPDKGPSVPATEAHLIVAVCKASKAVLLADRAPSSCASASSAYLQSKTGILLVEGRTVPPALKPLEVFGSLLLSRPAAVALWRKGLLRLLERESECLKGMTATATASALALESSLVGVMEGLLRGAPRPHQGVGASSKQHQEPTSGGAPKSKRKVKNASGNSGKDSQAAATSGSLTGRQQQGDGGAAEASPAPIPVSELLSGCCTCLVLAALLLRGAEASGSEGLSVVHEVGHEYGCALDCVVRAYAYLLQYQSQRLSAALWYNFSIFFTCYLWQWAMRAASGDIEYRDTNNLPFMRKLLSAPSSVTVLTALTEDTGSMLWLSPLLLPAYFSLSSLPNAAAEMLSQAPWSSPCRALWIAVLRAAANGESVGAETEAVKHASKISSPLWHQLHPVSGAFLLGVLCSRWSDAVLADVAECVAVAAVAGGDGAVVMASLIRMRMSEASAIKVAMQPTCGMELECVPASLSHAGLQRLLDEVEALQAKQLAAANSERQEEHEKSRRRVQEKLQSTQALAEAHRAFCEVAEARHAARTAEQQHVQEELQRRRAARDARLRDNAAALERKRQVALDKLRQKAVQTRAEAEAARQRRFSAYQRRLQSEYRVSTFLEHLMLSSARVMATREALRTVIDRITPDDLLEYLVSGEPKVPADMLGQDDSMDTADGVGAIGAALHEQSAVVSECQPQRQAPGPASPRPPVTGERCDFWSDVMDGAYTNERTSSQDNEKSSYRRIMDVAPEPAASTGAVLPHERSFHARIAPLMDLFCYDDGDEFGRVPDPLPILRLRIACRVWPAPQVQLLGFADVREAFERMRDRGLVRIHDDVAQLTLLGFRYHYPFHNPEGMLEVHLREARVRVQALVGVRNDLPCGQSPRHEASEGDDDIVDEEEEEGARVPYAQGRLLPELEFGI
ncbi:hypothetical protein GH5_02788 [Leishmania sp. Ghana 2012 LV757]|uniref:hypothetical protein n=1 Tax=Leishmania sp. Ghana 2012 LV757 TaxID=2803181 RepID=UPI001B3E6C67|nr:hypothetical protein GH5_02788 [Leishmania sp. Ghana 2012 LV757]